MLSTSSVCVSKLLSVAWVVGSVAAHGRYLRCCFHGTGETGWPLHTGASEASVTTSVWAL